MAPSFFKTTLKVRYGHLVKGGARSIPVRGAADLTGLDGLAMPGGEFGASYNPKLSASGLEL